MKSFLSAASHEADGARAARQCLDALSLPRGSRPSGSFVGFVYATRAHTADWPKILEILRDGSPETHWFGTIGSGVIAIANRGGPGSIWGASETHDAPALAIMVAEVNATQMRGFRANKPDLRDFETAQGAWLRTAFPGLAVLHGDPVNPATPDLVAEIAERTGALTIGGLSAHIGASRDEAEQGDGTRQSRLQIAETLSGGGVSGVMVAGKLEIATGLTQGCTPIGPWRTVTEGAENIVAELDGRPALDPFIEDIGPALAANLQQVAGRIFAAKPASDNDDGDYLVRNLMAIDPNRGWIAIGDTVEPGDRVMFCRRDRDAAEVDLRRMLDDLRMRAGKQPKAGLYYSCIARGPHLFARDRREIDLICETFGTFPLVGFFGNGEVSQGRLYGYTGVLTLFL